MITQPSPEVAFFIIFGPLVLALWAGGMWVVAEIVCSIWATIKRVKRQ